jgi:hypothetical protein
MAISSAKTSKDKFIVAVCSPELMEVWNDKSKTFS